MKIRVRTHWRDVHYQWASCSAVIEGEDIAPGYGKTFAEAVGNLVLQNGARFSVEDWQMPNMDELRAAQVKPADE